MKHKTLVTLILTFSYVALSAFPCFAGEWISQEDEKWQYIDDDGELFTGWLHLEEESYYLDSEGYRISGRWARISRDWYYFDEDGILATNTWIDNYHVDELGRKNKTR